MRARGRISSATMITRFAAKAAWRVTPSVPQTCAWPSSSARCTWRIATSGAIAGTSRSGAPDQGSVAALKVGLERGRSVPSSERVGR